ncbi:glycosyltransferase [Aquimarina gracilis]|uniref:Glycosyltransferase n=1 Tax=Aquimarina gracilis TaxID=874422 RepID=A0ABU6A2A0_9FLAO|nr:glycosyltransferase [Aquimarina gracilis]MEB3348181.1 glycosyltransferase [Aquimarina gracilis]
MKKILFFVESLSGGGAEKVLTDLVSNLDATKYDVTVCSLVDVGVYNEYLGTICTYKSILASEETYKGVLQKKWYGFKYKLLRKLPPKLFHSLFIKGKYDVEIAFLEGFSTKIIGNSSNPNSKKIAWVHIDLFANHWTKIEYKNLEEEINTYKKFDHIASVAESVQNAFSKRFGIKEKLSVKYNPVNRKDIISRSNESLKSEDKKGLRFVTVGRLEPQKGYDRLLEVVHKLKPDFDFELWIVGEGSRRLELESAIAKYKLEDVVTLQGFQKNPYKYIRLSDAFVCSSRSEGFSTVVTEALILGKPVIATDCSGMKELLGDNEYGIITENNTESLYFGLKKFLEDKLLQSHYTKKSQERSTDFDIKATIKSIEELL